MHLNTSYNEIDNKKIKKDNSNIITETNGYKYYPKLQTIELELGIPHSTFMKYYKNVDRLKNGIKKFQNEDGKIEPGYYIADKPKEAMIRYHNARKKNKTF